MTDRQIPFGKPMLGDEEKKAVCDVLDSGMLVHGNVIHEFEDAFKAFTGAPHAVGVSSCTAALHLAYFYLGIGPGNEVIVPAMTHVATAHAVEFTGAKPVFVDAELNTGNIDIDQIEAAITPNTKAISVVHYLGVPVDMERVCNIARKHNLFIVEDCALSLGASIKGIHTGLWGDVGCFSFYPVKHITTAEGGMLITKNERIARAIERQRAFGLTRFVNERKIPGQYDVSMLGYNYRMSEIHAAIGVEQLKHLAAFLDARRKNYDILNTGLAAVKEIRCFEYQAKRTVPSHYCFSIILDDDIAEMRQQVIEYLKACGVGTSVYYPSPVPCMSYYSHKYGVSEKNYPQALKIAEQSIALPCGPHVTPEDVSYIIDSVKNAIEGVC